MFMTPREAQWSMAPEMRAGQLSLTQRQSTSPSTLLSSALQTGQWVGEDDLAVAPRVFFVVDDFGDLGDDVAAALNGDKVADAHAETTDLVGVVERGAG